MRSVAGVPGPGVGEERFEAAGVVEQVGRELRGEGGRGEPIEAGGVGVGVARVGGGGEAAVVGFGGSGGGVVGGEERLVLVVEGGVEGGGVLRADGQGQVVFQRVERDVVAEHVAADGLIERVAAGLEALEEVGAAEALEAAAGAGEIRKRRRMFSVGLRRRIDVARQAVTRQVQRVNGGDGVVAEEHLVGVAGPVSDLDRPGDPLREVAAATIGHRKIDAAVVIGVAVFLLDEPAGAADEEQPHQVSPVVGEFALLEGGDGALPRVVPPLELDDPDRADQPLGAEAQVLILIHEEAKLTA